MGINNFQHYDIICAFELAQFGGQFLPTSTASSCTFINNVNRQKFP